MTAVLCGNDDVAAGVMRAAREAGRRIPGDLSVAGFDDVPVAAFLAPALTMVRLDFGGLGRTCFGLLHRCSISRHQRLNDRRRTGRRPHAGSHVLLRLPCPRTALAGIRGARWRQRC
ncbi:substrate-binding domain-containing protein [Streptomyces asiaticus]